MNAKKENVKNLNRYCLNHTIVFKDNNANKIIVLTCMILSGVFENLKNGHPMSEH